MACLAVHSRGHWLEYRNQRLELGVGPGRLHSKQQMEILNTVDRDTKLMATKWTRDQALAALHQYAAEADRLKSSSIYFSTEHVRWVTNCLRTLEEVFGRKSRYYQSFAALSWTSTDTHLVDPSSYEEQTAVYRQLAYFRDLDAAKGFLLAATDELSQRAIDEVYKGKDTAPETSLLLRVLSLGEKQLRKTIRGDPNDEQEVQNRFEDLLNGADIPYHREAERIPYSSKTYVPDFTLPRIDLAIDLKLCKAGREKEIIGEINDDIIAYKTKFGNLLFFVYDMGSIRDTEVFTKSFQNHEGVIVRVIKH